MAALLYSRHLLDSIGEMKKVIGKDLLNMLVCPESRQRLRLADAELVERVNHGIESGKIKNKAGTKLERLLDGGLLREDGRLFYPVLDEIPILLVDEAIVLDQFDE